MALEENHRYVPCELLKPAAVCERAPVDGEWPSSQDSATVEKDGRLKRGEPHAP